MKLIFIIFTFYFIFFSCSKKESTEPAPTTGTISGTVMNKTGDSLISAAIINTEPPTSSVSSDNEGKYTIEEVDPGNYIVQAVKDGYDPGNVNVIVKAGKTVTADIRMGILLANHPPTKPQLISPENNSEYQSVYSILKWKESSDQDGDAIVYDVYFGKENPPPLDVESTDSTSLKKNNLDTATVYYWQVVAKDSKGAKTASAIWQFKTTPNPIPTEGLIAYWPFNGNAKDKSGNGNDGIVYGTTLTTDRFGKENSAYYFDGLNDYIDIGNNVKPPFPATICLWLKIEDMSNNYCLFRNDIWDNTGYRYGLGINITKSGKINAYYFEGFSASWNRVGCSTPDSIYNDKNWHFFTVVYKTHKNVKLYYDGQKIPGEYDNGSGSGLSYSNHNGAIGVLKSHSGYEYLKGTVDDIRVYNRVLSSDEIQILFHEHGWKK